MRRTGRGSPLQGRARGRDVHHLDRWAVQHRPYFAAESFDSNAIASCTVVMNCAGKIMVEFFSTEISAIVCNVRNCSATGCAVMMSAASQA